MVTSMRKLCPNLDKEDGLDTVLEVPIPEEMFTKMGSTAAHRWQNMRNLMKAQRLDKQSAYTTAASRNDHFTLLLKLVGSAFIPFQAQLDHAIILPIKDGSIVRPNKLHASLYLQLFKEKISPYAFCFSNIVLNLANFMVFFFLSSR